MDKLTEYVIQKWIEEAGEDELSQRIKSLIADKATSKEGKIDASKIPSEDLQDFFVLYFKWREAKSTREDRMEVIFRWATQILEKELKAHEEFEKRKAKQKDG